MSWCPHGQVKQLDAVVKSAHIMEERERQVLIEKTCTNNIPSQSNHTTNGAEHFNGQAGFTVDTFSGIASKIIGSNMKGKVTSKLTDRTSNKFVKHTGALDDLPLGSEAHSLSSEYNTVTSYPLPEDKRSKWMKAAESQAIVGWQSFNSDVSNHTSASSASLEQLLNDRQVDPEEMLLSLGFGGEAQSLLPSLSRVPNRFLSHPSRAYGIAPPPPGQSASENVDSEAQDDVPATQQDGATTIAPASSAAAAAAAAQLAPKRRTGMWTLARTLSILRTKAAAATPPSRGHASPSSNSDSAAQPASILHPANQRYLASKGYYQKQGWPKGSFAEPEEGPSVFVSREGQESTDAASKRKLFHKSRSRPNWSMCDSGEDNSATGDWVTKSVDGLRSRDNAQDDSLARGAYFSTTTESSTDSLDTPNLETARAFEDIRRDFLASTQAERSSSEELFLPCQDSTDSSMQQQQLLNIQPAAGHNYFVSPASSRQATVEKAPTISDQSYTVHLADTDENITSSTDKQQQSPHCLLVVDGGAQAAFSDSGSSSTVTGLALALDEDVSEAGTHSSHTCSSSQTTDADFHIAHMLNINQKHSTKPGFVSKVQLSTLPANISHLELMKRLQHSQNELSRMGSVQSDSSGFGDADPALESAADAHKMKMSSRADSSAEAAKYGAVSERYVTMCYIPTLVSRAHQSTYNNPTLKATGGTTHLTALRCRPRAGSEPRVRAFSDQKRGAGSDLRRVANSDVRRVAGSDVRHVAGSDVRHVAGSDVRHVAGSDQKHADYVYHKSTPLPNLEAEAGLCMSPRVEHVRLKQAAAADPHIQDVRGKIFTSQIDLYTNTSGFSRQYVDKLRRHSDEGILEWRNDKPLSVELALANPPPPSSPARQSSSSIPPHISTTAAYSVATFDKTHAGIHYHPPLAGNIRGMDTTSFRRQTNMKMLASTSSRQKSCDILDDDCVSISTPPNITSCHDMDASSYSSVAESSSDFSSVSMAEQQHEYTHMSVLDSRKLARLINQPMYFKGKKRCASQYRPRHLFKEWNLLSKRKRLQEENQLLQNAVHKYKTELSILEASFLLDYQTIYADTTHDYREEVEELEWLWSEVKVQVMELEQLMMNRIRSVHAGNDFYNFMSNMGVIERMVELIKEQVFQQQLSTSRMWGGGEEEEKEEAAYMFDAAGHLLHSWLVQEGLRRGSLPAAANISIEQVKSSVFSQIKTELEASTTKLQHDLQENEREIKRLQEQLNRSDPNLGRWTRKSPSVRLHKSATRLQSRVATTPHVTRETDV